VGRSRAARRRLGAVADLSLRLAELTLLRSRHRYRRRRPHQTSGLADPARCAAKSARARYPAHRGSGCESARIEPADRIIVTGRRGVWSWGSSRSYPAPRSVATSSTPAVRQLLEHLAGPPPRRARASRVCRSAATRSTCCHVHTGLAAPDQGGTAFLERATGSGSRSSRLPRFLSSMPGASELHCPTAVGPRKRRRAQVLESRRSRIRDALGELRGPRTLICRRAHRQAPDVLVPVHMRSGRGMLDLAAVYLHCRRSVPRRIPRAASRRSVRWPCPPASTIFFFSTGSAAGAP